MTDYTNPTAAPQQRLDSLLEHNSAPPPPERGSSFAVMSQAFRSPVTATAQGSVSKNDISQSNSTITPKKVSFQESASEIGSNSTPVEKVLEDPNVSSINIARINFGCGEPIEKCCTYTV